MLPLKGLSLRAGLKLLLRLLLLLSLRYLPPPLRRGAGDGERVMDLGRRTGEGDRDGEYWECRDFAAAMGDAEPRPK